MLYKKNKKQRFSVLYDTQNRHFFTHPSIKKIYTNKSAKMEAMWAFGNRYHPQVRKISALQIYSHWLGFNFHSFGSVSTPRGNGNFPKAGFAAAGTGVSLHRRGRSRRWHSENRRRHSAFCRKALAPPTKFPPAFRRAAHRPPLLPQNFLQWTGN